ncbi:hypothetical protein CCP3SC15_940018 [Gammaproteobacteria bacterium]
MLLQSLQYNPNVYTMLHDDI